VKIGDMMAREKDKTLPPGPQRSKRIVAHIALRHTQERSRKQGVYQDDKNRFTVQSEHHRDP